MEIRDTGCGMTQEVLKRATEPFFTTKSGRSGVGLTAAHGIWRRHRGALSIESQPGEGTMIRLAVEAPAAQAPNGASSHRTESSATPNRLRLPSPNRATEPRASSTGIRRRHQSPLLTRRTRSRPKGDLPTQVGTPPLGRPAIALQAASIRYGTILSSPVRHSPHPPVGRDRWAIGYETCRSLGRRIRRRREPPRHPANERPHESHRVPRGGRYPPGERLGSEDPGTDRRDRPPDRQRDLRDRPALRARDRPGPGPRHDPGP